MQQIFISSPERDTEKDLEYREPKDVDELRQGIAEAPNLARLLMATPIGGMMVYSGPLEEAPDGAYFFQWSNGNQATLHKKGMLFRVE